MAQQIIDTTTPQPNGKTGDTAKIAFGKVNDNFTELYNGKLDTAATAAAATKLAIPRTITIGNTGKAFDGTADVSWSLDEIGAARFGTIASGTDLNSVVSTGFYRLGESPGNAPVGVQNGQLIVARGGGDTILQIVTGHDNGEIFWRQGNPPDVGGTGSWSAWHRFWHSGNTPAILSGNGYQRLPSGLIVQWGTVTTGGDGAATFIFPIAFPTAALITYATLATGASPPTAFAGSDAASTTSVVVRAASSSGVSAGSGVGIRVFAIGH